VAELCAAGLGAVLVPLVVRTTSHQQGNAQHLAALGAAVHLRQADCTPEGLAGVLRGFTRVRLVEMARRARALGRPDATRAAVEAIAEVADRGPLFA
jgi:UDP-N-acetylglucosamine--N-acetylmuramyl-(pentapeptide) pyrophosphoryl-undecaprenol N-acetylglucosamine transferase